jgi:hypothetical protein
MLLMMESDSVVWIVKGIEDRSGKQERQIDDAQILRRINQRKEILMEKDEW